MTHEHRTARMRIDRSIHDTREALAVVERGAVRLARGQHRHVVVDLSAEAVCDLPACAAKPKLKASIATPVAIAHAPEHAVR